MFLPVLLVRDYGVMGWVVFAIPNVIGAAAMGWVLRDGMSERIVREHSTAIEWFRLVTVVFQLWFLVAFLLWTPGEIDSRMPGQERWIVLGALVVGAILGINVRSGVLALLASVLFAGWTLRGTGLAIPSSIGTPATGALWLAPVCAFGFALCPYLDPTFHRARQGTSESGARAAFSVGFGVLFLSMILVTLFYAVWAVRVSNSLASLIAVLPVFLAAHIGMQLTYTCTVHARATPGRGPWTAPRISFALLLAGAVAVATYFLPTHTGLQGREVVYRSFMSFYGLVFPAYVWLLMVPNGTAARSALDSRRAMRVFWVSAGLAAPFYWMGFIERQEFWLVPGLAIVLLARLFVLPRRA